MDYGYIALKNNIRFVVPTLKIATSCDNPDSEENERSPEEILLEETIGGNIDADINLENETIDVENIPVGSWFQVTVNLYKQQIEIYINGKLRNSTVLIGNSIFYQDDIQFCKFNQFSGYIANFRYMPHVLPTKVIEMLYNHKSSRNLKYLNNLLCNR